MKLDLVPRVCTPPGQAAPCLVRRTKLKVQLDRRGDLGYCCERRRPEIAAEDFHTKFIPQRLFDVNSTPTKVRKSSDVPRRELGEPSVTFDQLRLRLELIFQGRACHVRGVALERGRGGHPL